MQTVRGRRTRDCMVVGFTTTYAISTYQYDTSDAIQRLEYQSDLKKTTKTTKKAKKTHSMKRSLIYSIFFVFFFRGSTQW
jgi:hypothetical protein